MKFYKQQHEFYCGIDLDARLRRRSRWKQAASQEL